MAPATTDLKTLAKRLGADLIGVTSRAKLADGPPSADPRYLLPSANSVISFAVSLLCGPCRRGRTPGLEWQSADPEIRRVG
ncbi:hypothetical protein DSCA_34320 [Desulfosarcina alkanivorans]|uniref:Uncharacterized protein n=1 Tax=Desulfosarcina alkanivorans TaxID=571177 RepID=A0A5K7YIK7_9BACT|nr:hypothetical protein DSCA_34320 [Desulfosarcina alkanivorans]